MIESDYQRLLLLEAPKRLPNIRLFPRRIAAVQIEERFVSFGIKGQADVQAILKGGQLIECELKALGGSLTPEQKVWRDFCKMWNVPWLLLKPLKGEEPEATVARWCEEIRVASLAAASFKPASESAASRTQ